MPPVPKKITELPSAGTLDGSEVAPVVQGGATVKTPLSALPVGTATATALNLKANLAGPIFTGDPKAPTPSPGDNDTSISTTAFVSAAITAHAAAADPHGDRAYADSLFAANDALVYKGAIDASSNPNYPAASAGHLYKISVAGKIGGASGPNVEVGDSILCTVDGTSAGTQAAVGANWSIIQTNIDGAVIGPAGSVSGNLATFSGTGGKLIQDSGRAPASAGGVPTLDGSSRVVQSPKLHASDHLPGGADAMTGLAVPWAATTAFIANQLLTYQGQMYLTRSAFTSGATFDLATVDPVPKVAAQGLRGDGYIPLAARQASAPGYSQLSNGTTDTSINTRSRCLAAFDAHNVRLVYHNHNGLNNINISAGVEFPDGTAVPVYFQGQRVVTIGVNGYVVSDPVGIKVTKNAAIFIRTLCAVTGGDKWRVNHIAEDTGEAAEITVTDKTLTGTISSGGSTTSCVAPMMVLSRPARREPSVVVLGDSIVCLGTPGTDVVRFWKVAFDGKVSVTIAAIGGDTLSSYIDDATPADLASGIGYRAMRRLLPGTGTDLLGQIGTNDVTSGTLAAFQANVLNVATQYDRRGVRVRWTTLVPRTTSTDAWATTVNQTTITGQATRTGFNDWLRAGAPIDPTTKAAVAIGTGGALLAGSAGHPLRGYHEVADTVESARNSGFWKAPGYTTDGIHASATAHVAMAAGIDTTVYA